MGPQGLVDPLRRFFLPWPALSMKLTGIPSSSWMFRLVAFISYLLLYVLSPETLILKKHAFGTVWNGIPGSNKHATSVTTSSFFSFQFMGIWVGSCLSGKRLPAWKPHLPPCQQRAAYIHRTLSLNNSKAVLVSQFGFAYKLFFRPSCWDYTFREFFVCLLIVRHGTIQYISFVSW